jgi:hypothetical protein
MMDEQNQQLGLDQEMQDEAPQPARTRVTNAELNSRMNEFDQRMAEMDARMAEMDVRERDLDMREMEMKSEPVMAPREREEFISTRSRAADETARLERQSMDFYAPPSQMEIPKDDVFYYRWIRESVNGIADPANVQKRIREGYERVKMSDLPEDFIVDEDLRGDGYARTSGLILMRIPHQRKAAIDKYYLGRSEERLHSADELQGLARGDYVKEDRGSRSLTGVDAQRALSQMSQG